MFVACQLLEHWLAVTLAETRGGGGGEDNKDDENDDDDDDDDDEPVGFAAIPGHGSPGRGRALRSARPPPSADPLARLQVPAKQVAAALASLESVLVGVAAGSAPSVRPAALAALRTAGDLTRALIGPAAATPVCQVRHNTPRRRRGLRGLGGTGPTD